MLLPLADITFMTFWTLNYAGTINFEYIPILQRFYLNYIRKWWTALLQRFYIFQIAYI